jgi:hypothetical protein
VTPAGAVSARWATGVDGAAERAYLRETLTAGRRTAPDELWVLARAGTGVVTPADMLAET